MKKGIFRARSNIIMLVSIFGIMLSGCQTKEKKTCYNVIRWDKNREKWQLHLTNNGQRESFGYYSNEIEAAKAYDCVVQKYHGDYVCLNFPKK